MLERIAEIQGIGLLHDANGKPHTCKKATLIYADNGRGKSTLATVLRSVSIGDTSLITARKTVDGTLPPKVLLHFGSGHKVSFDNGAWSELRPEVLVFDADFVDRNVYSGGTVTTNHRKNLLEFALGELAVTARNDVEIATNETKVATEKVQSIIGQLSGHHSGMPLALFEKLPQVADIESNITELQKRINASGNIAAILTKSVPTLIPEPNFDIDGFFSGLNISLDDVHADAEQIVKAHVETLNNKFSESWLSQGQQFDDNKSCPYCSQDTSSNDLIRAYRTHFNTAYASLKTKVATISNAAKLATDPGIVDKFAQSAELVALQTTAWAEYVQVQPIQFEAKVVQTDLSELHGLVLDLCQRKSASPADKVGNDLEKQNITALWQKVIAPIQSINFSIKTDIEAIDLYKGQLASENVPQLQQQVQQLQATKRRYDTAVVDLIDKLTAARSEVEVTEKTKTTARDNLNALMIATLDKYEKSINDLLKSFGASFSIKGMGANFRGAAPRSEYGLLLRGKDVSLEGGPPSFSTTLSEGDKRTLAFAFFVASTLADTALNTRTVVIDDPMCSLDLNRKHQTRLVLKKIYTKADQLIVLAHNPYFIRDLRDALRKDDSTASIATLLLALAAGDYSDFDTFDVDKECESAYFQHHRLLNDFTAGQKCDSKSVAKAIRPMLEGYLHRRFPGIIPKSLLFGQVVALIRDAVAPSPLCHAASLVDGLNEINDYAGQFHHDTNPGGADSVLITASELKTVVDRALEAVHKGV